MNHDLHDGIREQAGASRQRLEDARVLLRAARWRGAIYDGIKNIKTENLRFA